ncbi:MAG: hypothetical protein H0U44_04135 [Flavisolibacter sp.]|jgi:hypothetical protein|nr:hypothetical protein [Flavisolibacter sp.]
MPFTVLGGPDLKVKYAFSFTPVSIQGKSETPLHQDSACFGLDLRNYNTDPDRKAGKINIQWMLEMYSAYPNKEKFFDFSQSWQMGEHIETGRNFEIQATDHCRCF